MSTLTRHFSVIGARFPFKIQSLQSARKEYRNLNSSEAITYLRIHCWRNSPHYLPFIIRPSGMGSPYYIITFRKGSGFAHYIFSEAGGQYNLYLYSKCLNMPVFYRTFPDEATFWAEINKSTFNPRS